ncbi:hypothetical protein GOP47_0009360 [Adiantum capillus-veneris]|uniref:Glutathione peroxidase n=1 Tax=Adiantum capillus-veneris TaxID=13818 RepID=A0A9D4UWR2_ADICA|nr:hypothetical protein GOP47_0009360 [Adiantum capillus-veneris]
MGAGYSSAEIPQKKSIHEFTVKNAAGNDVDLSMYKGKVLLVVNVASRCGLTNDNYTQLAELHAKYKDKGFEILAFPCNQFLNQEPGSNEKIQEFACTRFKTEFPIFDKINVNGKDTAPVYSFLKATSKPGKFGSRISWNFTKFLIDPDGHVKDRYGPSKPPMKIENDIKSLLGL